MTVDRRKEPRYPARFSGMVFVGDQVHPAYAEDVSVHGLFLRMDNPAPEKQLLKLVLVPENTPPITLFGKVAHTAKPGPNSNGRVGVGIELCPVFGQRTSWIDVIAKHRTAFEARRKEEYAAGSESGVCPRGPSEEATVDVGSDAESKIESLLS